jgi:3-oxoacyl-[acyl-carrier protein] reductase
MDLGLSSKTALVLGASSGLGFAIAQCLAKEGARVVASARPSERLERALGALQTSGSATTLPLDLQNEAQVAAAERAVRELSPDIVVCNSGGPPAGSALDSDLDLWRAQFEAMVISQIRIIRAALPGMQQRKWGRILVVASSGVVAPIPNLAISNGLRSALVSFAKTLAAEVAPSGITVNTIVPGRIATPRVAQLDQIAAERQKATVQSVQQKSIATIPMGRYGEPEEFAAVAAFLVSERASYVSGQMTRVDGAFIRSI